MATAGSRHSFSPIDVESSEDTAEALFAKKRRCFCIPCLDTSHGSSTNGGLNWWRRVSTRGSDQETLWSRGVSALKKLREWSEIVAGPRWKTFIRRFNRSRSGGGSGSGGRSGKFQYDPLSYALNFDEGPGQNGDLEGNDEDYRFRNFSSRYASMDLGKDGPAFA
ncbi:hypothetical protein RJ639_034646 [Escallonia herrerae]|uniref:Uncharacterized protein n=1 Tax=Escallonia herrerae TaxID=1293975 RepID=A0AA88X521_9ASTE|nr:hypothetical protein RJ639_034646 [Escallonia herrerae]